MGTLGTAQESNIQNSNNVKNGHNDKKWAKNVAELGENGNSILLQKNKSAHKFYIYSHRYFLYIFNFEFESQNMLRCLFNFIVVSSALRISYIPNSCCFKMFKSPCILLFNNAFHSIVNIVEVLNIDNDTIFREGTYL